MPRAGKLDDMYFAGGYCGHGIAMATYLGELGRAAHGPANRRASAVRRPVRGDPVLQRPAVVLRSSARTIVSAISLTERTVVAK